MLNPAVSTLQLVNDIAAGRVDWEDMDLWQRLEHEDLPGAMEYLQIIFRWAREPEASVKEPAVVQNLFTGYRHVLEALSEPTQACWTCKGEQEVTEYYAGTGFAGGRIYMDTLACGHINADESDDMRAAY